MASSSANARDLTTGSVSSQMVRLSAPMVWGILAVMSIGVVDTYFVGQLGTDQLAALSFCFPVMFTLSSLAIGLGAGAASVVSREIGCKNASQVRRLATDSLALSVVFVAIFSLLGWLTIRPLFSLLGAQGPVLEYIVDYMQIWFPSMILLVVPMVANSLVRAAGDSFWPSLVMIVAAVANVILDPLLILGLAGFPKLGIEGAAWATVGARFFTLIAALYLVHFRERLIEWTLPSMHALRASWKRVLAIGIPAAAGNMANPAGLAVVTAALATLGETTVAGFGVATRIESFAMIPMFALSAAIGPFSGQNWGGGEAQRVRQALNDSAIFCVAWSLALAIIFWFAGGWLVSQFTTDPAVTESGVDYLRLVAFSFGGYGVLAVISGAFNAIGRPVVAFSGYFLRTAVVYVPLAWLLVEPFGEAGVYGSAVVANLGVGIGAFIYAQRQLHRST